MAGKVMAILITLLFQEMEKLLHLNRIPATWYRMIKMEFVMFLFGIPLQIKWKE